MKKQSVVDIVVVLLALVAVLASGTLNAAAQPPAPVPISPAEGSTIVIPTFSWQASGGAETYDIEVGPQSNPNTVYWSNSTYQLSLTSASCTGLPNEPLYWRVRGVDSGDTPGPWTSKINFTKHIPAPLLVSPANGSSIVVPTLEWQAVEGAAYYKVDLSTSPTFYTLDHTYTTYNTRIIPVDAIAHSAPWYWRVSGVDACDHVGTASGGWSFTKTIPAPTLVSPGNGADIVVPTLEWQAVEGAAYYKVEVSTSPTFVPMEATYETYNTRITPASTLPHGTLYWRVSGVDANDHVGTPSGGWSFVKTIPPPALVSPGEGANVDIPTLEWAAVEGAAYYKVELSTEPDFTPLYRTLLTYNTRITPKDAVALGTYYWRVSGVDVDDHVGTPSAGRSLTLNAPPAPSDLIPVLIAPDDGEVIAADPTYNWTQVVDAANYHVIVSTDPGFGSTYDSVYTDYTTYTPYDDAGRPTYANGTYYWKVEAWNGGTLIGTSEARSFSRQMALPLTAPADGAALAADPTFQWAQPAGAGTYHLIVSTDPGFGSTYDSVYTDYTTYTPYDDAGRAAYANGTYYWKVQAWNGGTLIATSEARSFSRQMALPLTAPVDGAALAADPTFQWAQPAGAGTYHLIVSTDPGFGSTYDSVYTDYTTYTPYDAAGRPAYANGTYYWKVEAWNGGTLIATSEARSFSRQMALTLTAPADGAVLAATPTFQWARLVGVDHYHLIVSTDPGFGSTYDSVYTDYTTYTPYDDAGRPTYANGTYYWKVQAWNGGTLIATSDAWIFSIGLHRVYLPVVMRQYP